MPIDGYQTVLVAAVFLGAIVQGFSGFAFSAVAGAIILQVESPAAAVPLLMICSLLIQGYVLFQLRAVVSLRLSFPYIAGGTGGVILAATTFDLLDPNVFRRVFGALLIAYACATLLRTQLAVLSIKERRLGKAAVGFAGGFVGGLTAMPAVILVVWGDALGTPRMAQRAILQPFIAAMQALALVLLIATARVSITDVTRHLPLALPAMLIGAALGLFLFGKVSDAGFRRAMSALLLCSGIALVLAL